MNQANIRAIYYFHDGPGLVRSENCHSQLSGFDSPRAHRNHCNHSIDKILGYAILIKNPQEKAP